MRVLGGVPHGQQVVLGLVVGHDAVDVGEPPVADDHVDAGGVEGAELGGEVAALAHIVRRGGVAAAQL